MNINNLKGLLLELAYLNSSKVSPSGRAEGVTRIIDVLSAGEGFKKPGYESPSPGGKTPAFKAQHAPETSVNPPSFIPLPIKTDLFREARFLARYSEEKLSGTDEQFAEIFICLLTMHLGRIWINLNSKKNSLSVKFFTDSEQAGNTLKESFQPLAGALEKTGYPDITLTSLVRPELSAVIEGLLPKLEEHLLDRKI